MKKYINLTVFIAVLTLIIYGCQAEDSHGPYGSDGDAPGVVTVDNVVNRPGGAVIYYTPPADVDLLYVKASFNDDRGRSREVRVSQVIDSLVIEGFGQVGEYNVTLNAVDRGENFSAPTNVEISPLTPPVQLIFPTLVGEVAYGGINIAFENPLEAEVSINIEVFDETQGEFVYRESFFTSQADGDYTFRGYPAVLTEFAVYIEDRWENVSEKVYFEVTPIPDEYLEKTLFSIFTLQGDKDFNHDNDVFGETQMWDNVSNSQWNGGHTNGTTPLPHYLTIDLGVNVKLSRFKLFQRTGEEIYKHGNPKIFNVYGVTDVNDLPPYNSASPNEGWTLLKQCESFKPSGLPVGQVTAEDREFQSKGEDFEFDVDNLVEVRYIRFEILENWGNIDNTVIGELSFWGEIAE
ncbi:DUF5000 domain-containing lipoprotein [Winogradskyella bathintestinalis]|uniref:DUF5000 domain-containing lipoprotein n=1 Tax=Winogradskyella bathintestinalis TaxID=3035208 RepID=A0ABT7ZUN4_9FLAO|nr:DUF5000 domain-containing lipoprotein [Winogradskyella bathintestinalis]MDN3492739.1 DUF5000 domain-containing lipoprotein [Winogradskyella bathintestinalis]